MRALVELANEHDAFSKKWENHAAMIGLFVAWYNYCRPHMRLSHKRAKTMPAMAHGLTDHVWTIEELLTAAA